MALHYFLSLINLQKYRKIKKVFLIPDNLGLGLIWIFG